MGACFESRRGDLDALIAAEDPAAWIRVLVCMLDESVFLWVLAVVSRFRLLGHTVNIRGR